MHTDGRAATCPLDGPIIITDGNEKLQPSTEAHDEMRVNTAVDGMRRCNGRRSLADCFC